MAVEGGILPAHTQERRHEDIANQSQAAKARDKSDNTEAMRCCKISPFRAVLPLHV